MRIVLRDQRRLASTGAAVLVLGVATGCMMTTRSSTPPASTVAAGEMVAPGVSYVRATTPEQAGEYLTVLGGCNDCHTERWAESNGNVPQTDRLAGSRVGYRGPWGTTYAANLRLVVQRLPEDRWVTMLKTAAGGHGAPPMPWMNTRLMSDQDLRAMYRYIHSLGPMGERMPRSVPPGTEPTTPYIDMMPKGAAAAAP